MALVERSNIVLHGFWDSEWPQELEPPPPGDPPDFSLISPAQWDTALAKLRALFQSIPEDTFSAESISTYATIDPYGRLNYSVTLVNFRVNGEVERNSLVIPQMFAQIFQNAPTLSYRAVTQSFSGVDNNGFGWANP